MKKFLFSLFCAGLAAFAVLRGGQETAGAKVVDSAETTQLLSVEHIPHRPAVSDTDAGDSAEIVPYIFDSRTAKTSPTLEDDAPIFQHDIVLEGAVWMRVHFDEYSLAPGDQLILTSLFDSGVQTHTLRTLPQWGDKSAYFNGDGVRVELYANPKNDSYITVSSVMRSNAPRSVPQSLCEGDNRTPSSDNRVARLTTQRPAPGGGVTRGVCTAWPVSTGGVLTAGHCVDWDPDGFGSGLPDGNSDLIAGDVIEFNVPPSTATGFPQYAAPDDQFAVDIGSEAFDYIGEGEGLGADWAVFHVNPQANGDTPHRDYGWWRMTRDAPTEDAAIRITGYGADSTPNQTFNSIQQTSTGDYHGEHNDEGLYHEYLTDTMGGNSGGPIIWNAIQYTIGIHTNGGCDIGVIFDDGNTGTSFENDVLENAIDHSFELTAIHVDGVHRNRTNAGNGGPFDPFSTVGGAHSWTQFAWSQLRIVAGNYDEAVLLDKPMTLVAPVGTVVIGE